ncbi:YbgA family protein [Halanaerocella petrolearia]
MVDFIKPVLVISRCLGFAPCRYNGKQINDQFIEKLRDFVEIITVCPEVEIGLGVPRSPVRLVSVDDQLRLVQPANDRDVTGDMKEFSQDFFNSLTEVDGFILKNRSPSCGTNDSKVYQDIDGKIPVGKSSGLFSSYVQEEFSDLAIENEGRLKNFRIREDFLTRLFLLARFRKVKAANSMKELVKFHSRNKLLLLAYNEEQMRQLGRIVANHNQNKFEKVVIDYETNLKQALSKRADYKSNINVLMHAFGHFSNYLVTEEKNFFLNTVGKYRHGKVPLSVPINILKAWTIKYEIEYLREQTFFTPYPEELVQIKDSGKGINL